MVSKEKLRLDVKWATQQRLQYIEIRAFYAGVVTRSDIAKTFTLSDAAATKDLKLYSDLVPQNLIYNHSVFGFVPSPSFSPAFANLAPTLVLPTFAANLSTLSGGPQTSIYGLATAELPLPMRFPSAEVLAQITRAMHGKKKLQVSYRSLSDRQTDATRIIEPHALVDNGLRWHVRAYSEETYDFRDFVLSRILQAECLKDAAESGVEYDDDWTEMVSLRLAPHSKLSADKRASLLLDYAAKGEVIEVGVRRALLGYILQRLNVDTTADHSMNPKAYQLILLNRDEIEPYAAWAFHTN